MWRAIELGDTSVSAYDVMMQIWLVKKLFWPSSKGKLAEVGWLYEKCAFHWRKSQCIVRLVLSGVAIYVIV